MNTRRISYDILFKIEKEDLYVSDLLDDALRTFQFSDKRDRAFITRIVEGVTERKISLDFLIDKFSKKGKSSNGLKPEIRMILRMGIYQIRYMDSVPDRAAISESVELTKELGLEGLSGFVNGLLRSVARAKEERKLDSFLVSRMDTRYSTPKWLCDFLVEAYGKDTARAILEDQFKEHDTVVRVNTLKTDKYSLKKLFEEKGIEVKDGILSDRCLRISGYDSVRRLPGYNDGLFVIQDETSVYTVEHIGIKPGDKVLDMCAAPGGKSMLAYELTSANGQGEKAVISGGTVVSRDISENKIEKIKENAERLGIFGDKEREVEERTGFMLEIGDATALDKSISELKDDDKFDVVIADVPCSGLGIIGRKNDIKYHMSPEIMKELSEQGLIILKNASNYVKPKGRICFSTCTINPVENGEVVRRLLEEDNNKDKYSIVEEKAFLQGIDGSDGFYFCIIQKER